MPIEVRPTPLGAEDLASDTPLKCCLQWLAFHTEKWMHNSHAHSANDFDRSCELFELMSSRESKKHRSSLSEVSSQMTYHNSAFPSYLLKGRNKLRICLSPLLALQCRFRRRLRGLSFVCGVEECLTR